MWDLPLARAESGVNLGRAKIVTKRWWRVAAAGRHNHDLGEQIRNGGKRCAKC